MEQPKQQIAMFDDIDSLIEFLGNSHDAATAATTPEQQEVGEGDFWKRNVGGLQIFGYVYNRMDMRDAALDAGCSSDEADEEVAHIVHQLENGYLFGRCYSVVVPEGELGSTHRSQVTRITQQEFESAREKGWHDVHQF